MIGAVATAPIIGCQEPTHIWHPAYDFTYGDIAIKIYESAAVPGPLDEWQKRAIRIALAVGADGLWAAFEIAIIVSRQNGKGEILIALELFWLYYLHEPLVTHSAHLFETCREHFLKITSIIRHTPWLWKRTLKIRAGRGSEEIIAKEIRDEFGKLLCRESRLKFMSRKGGAGRGFTGGKIVADEAMILDAEMVAASIPTVSTRGDAQVIYAASAGLKDSTQLALCRRRGLAKDPNIALLLWEATPPVYDENGRLVGGDDPYQEKTWAKVNPAYGRPHARSSLSMKAIEREALAMGGFESPTFWRERLGIGQYPEDDDRWEIVSKEAYKATFDAESMISDKSVPMLAIDTQDGITSISVAGLRRDGKIHFEVAARHRGVTWVIDKLLGKPGHEHAHPVLGELGLLERLGKRVKITALKNGEATEVVMKIAQEVKDELRPKELRRVVWPTELEYAAACSGFAEGIRAGVIRQPGVQSTERALGPASKRLNPEGGWRFNRDVPVPQDTTVGPALAIWLVEKYGRKMPKSAIW